MHDVYTFIIYLVVIMLNLYGVILTTSQLPISARRAKNAYQYQHAVQKMHINDVTITSTSQQTSLYSQILQNATVISAYEIYDK
jgi:hypothetical protein